MCSNMNHALIPARYRKIHVPAMLGLREVVGQYHSAHRASKAPGVEKRMGRITYPWEDEMSEKISPPIPSHRPLEGNVDSTRMAVQQVVCFPGLL